MREILFRGKRTGDGEWVEGYLTYRYRYDQQSRKEILGPVIDCLQEVTIGNKTGKAIGSYQVAPGTDGQYTGLTDKNGEKIFEGDVVDILTENEEIGVVEYDDGGFLVSADGFCVDFHSNINGTDLEIIGNIHDNPELLEGE